MKPYSKGFFIKEEQSNNQFNFEYRHSPKIYVTSLVEGTLDDVAPGEKVAFEDLVDGKARPCIGLQHFVKTEAGGIPIYIFDNHNHAFTFWHLERANGTVKDGAALIHIDQHKDTREPASYLTKKDAKDPEKVFRYTNTVLNVGNFIPPAQRTGLIGDIINISSMAELVSIQNQIPPEKKADYNLILDIDLDFFAPELDYIDNNLKISTIKKLIPQANLITVATSPFFIDQELAIKYLLKIFS